MPGDAKMMSEEGCYAIAPCARSCPRSGDVEVNLFDPRNELVCYVYLFAVLMIERDQQAVWKPNSPEIKVLKQYHLQLTSSGQAGISPSQ